jgi:hypothetical protein
MNKKKTFFVYIYYIVACRQLNRKGGVDLGMFQIKMLKLS